MSNVALPPWQKRRNGLGCFATAERTFCLSCALITMLCSPCSASSRVETAVVTDVGGLPCFSVPRTSETKHGIPLFTLSVTREPGPHDNLPEEVWSFAVQPPGNSIVALPEKCFRYGVAPRVAGRSHSKSLVPYVIYSVTIQAKQEKTNLKGYTVDFCARPGPTGKMRVQAIQWDDKTSRWDTSVCAKPQSTPFPADLKLPEIWENAVNGTRK